MKMTNEEAKIFLQSRIELIDKYYPQVEDYREALDMAIKALEQEPCEDCISRKDVIILIDEATELHPYKVIGNSETYSNYNQGWEDACNWLYANIESDNLKTVIPQPKTGHWEELGIVMEGRMYEHGECDMQDAWVCDYCGYQVHMPTKYCPNCGAKMEVNEDDE